MKHPFDLDAMLDSLTVFFMELTLLEDTVEYVESRVSSELDHLVGELRELAPQLEAEWTREGEQDIQNENRDPTPAEERYAQLDEAACARRGHARLLRSSLFLATYAAFEQALEDLAGEWQRRRGQDLKPRDLRDRGIERSKAYLSKVVGLSFPADTREWALICHLRAIRNQLAHEGTHLSRPPGRRLQAAFGAFPGIYSEEDRKISLSSDFLQEVFAILKAFTKMLRRVSFDLKTRKPELLED